jgi:hypothetical protein
MSNRNQRRKQMEERMKASLARQLGCKSIEEVDERIKQNLAKSKSTKSE